MTGPSISPENWFRTAGGEEMVAYMMPACDRELAYEILSNCVRASEILDTDREFADSLRNAIEMCIRDSIKSNPMFIVMDFCLSAVKRSTRTLSGFVAKYSRL